MSWWRNKCVLLLNITSYESTALSFMAENTHLTEIGSSQELYKCLFGKNTYSELIVLHLKLTGSLLHSIDLLHQFPAGLWKFHKVAKITLFKMFKFPYIFDQNSFDRSFLSIQKISNNHFPEMSKSCWKVTIYKCYTKDKLT